MIFQRGKMKNGYIRIRLEPTSRIHDTRIYEHRHVMQQYLGRPLTNKEVVHHLNGKRDDNRIENLELKATQSEHIRPHIKKDMHDRFCYKCKRKTCITKEGYEKWYIFNKRFECHNCHRKRKRISSIKNNKI
jgi:HNH endonuclease